MMKLAKTCFIAAVAAGAILPAIAESTAAVPQPKLQAIAAEKSARDAESAKIVQRMKAMRLPIISFAPPMNVPPEISAVTPFTAVTGLPLLVECATSNAALFELTTVPPVTLMEIG